MTATAIVSPTASMATPVRTGQTGQRVEVGRYVLPDGQARILYAQRILGCVRISDHPAEGPGRRYVIERGLEEDGHGAHAALEALVVDYLAQAARHREIPMLHIPTIGGELS